ncbi:CRISPR-associated protein, Cse2 family [Bifidobacterium actinocoloniiforme DSM 22766]|uniref:CRISPR-associated protein, Cse2 family n=1 Tax=Bifidobacterium actinocoloniiforme DSM 22766 TaxID=1437605 RepID=A0A086YYI9_9BIFI|nr:type I-E CRISPR-associated protein Cse2/CasB [Bifidobacterium actinocoloniiforme]KFI39339.1 CRISPR-associated protein, Cse2 family [Bifidobacterium actinocoloniiforme DSM 22766]
MGESSTGGKAWQVGLYANTIIQKLQGELTGKNPRAKANARASLARLRKLGTSAYSPWMVIGDQVLSDWPEDKLGVPSEGSYAVRAVTATLRLYALHQQSQSSRMAAQITADDNEERQQQRRSTAFGAVCRKINLDLDSSQGVRKRLDNVYAASDFDGIVKNLCPLIALIRASKQSDSAKQIDYCQLAQDLYLVQFDDARQSVFFRWGRDYFCFPPSDKNSSPRSSKNQTAE